MKDTLLDIAAYIARFLLICVAGVALFVTCAVLLQISLFILSAIGIELT